MTRRKYDITIHTSRSEGMHENKFGVPYHKMSKTALRDTIKVYTQKIEIIAERNGRFVLEDIINTLLIIT